MRGYMLGIVVSASVILFFVAFAWSMAALVSHQNERYDRLRKECLDRGFAFMTHGPNIENTDCLPPDAVRGK